MNVWRLTSVLFHLAYKAPSQFTILSERILPRFSLLLSFHFLSGSMEFKWSVNSCYILHLLLGVSIVHIAKPPTWGCGGVRSASSSKYSMYRLHTIWYTEEPIKLPLETNISSSLSSLRSWTIRVSFNSNSASAGRLHQIKRLNLFNPSVLFGVAFFSSLLFYFCFNLIFVNLRLLCHSKTVWCWGFNWQSRHFHLNLFLPDSHINIIFGTASILFFSWFYSTGHPKLRQTLFKMLIIFLNPY